MVSRGSRNYDLSIEELHLLKNKFREPAAGPR